MNTGVLQKRFVEVKPLMYDKETRIVSMCIEKATLNESNGNGRAVEKNGYTCYQVQIDGLMDYGHVKSQLIEAAFAQKDEFGFLMNAVADIISVLFENNKVDGLTKDVVAFKDFMEYRQLCADTAKEIVEEYV